MKKTIKVLGLLVLMVGCSTRPTDQPGVTISPDSLPTDPISNLVPSPSPTSIYEEFHQIINEIKESLPLPSAYPGPLPEDAVARLGVGDFGKMELSPDGNILAVAGSIGIHLLNPRTLEWLDLILTEYPISGISWSPDGKMIAAYGRVSKKIDIFDLESRRWTNEINTGDFFSLAWSPTEGYLAGGSEDGRLILWDAESGQTVEEIQVVKNQDEIGKLNGIKILAWSPDGRFVVFNGEKDKIVVWDIHAGESTFEFEGTYYNQGPVVGWSLDGDKLAVFLGEEGISIWDVKTWKKVGDVDVSMTWIRSIGWSPDGQFLAICGGDMYPVKIWSLRKQEMHQQLFGHTSPVACEWDKEGDELIASDGKLLIKWDVNNGERLAAVRGTYGGSRVVEWGPEGDYLVSAESNLALWHFSSGRSVFSFDDYVGIWPGYGNLYTGLTFFPGSYYLLTTGGYGYQSVWELSEGQLIPWDWDKEIQKWRSPEGKFTAEKLENHLTILDDASGEILTEIIYPFNWESLGGQNRWEISMEEEIIIVLDTETNTEVLEINTNEAGRVEMALSPNGLDLAVGYRDGTIQIWDLATGSKKTEWRAHQVGVGKIAWSPDGEIIASAINFMPIDCFSIAHQGLCEWDFDNALTIWNPETGEIIRNLVGHTAGVTDLQWSANGVYLASASWDGTVIVWGVKD